MNGEIDSEKIRALLDAKLADSEPSAADITQIWREVAAAIQMPPPPTPAGKLLVLKKLALIIVASAGVATAWLATRPPAMQRVERPPLIETPTEAVIAPPSGEPTFPTPPRRTATAPHVSPPLAPPSSTLHEEVDLLKRAREALANGAPERALGYVSEHERRFAHGVLAEERDFLRISVLRSLGQPEADTRARAFLRDYPDSSHRGELEN